MCATSVCAAIAPQVRAARASLAAPDWMAQYAEGDQVLAYHGPLIHEATIRSVETKDAPDGKGKIRLYLIAYDQWSEHWAEWVPESRVMKRSNENYAVQKDRVKEFQRAHKRKLSKSDAGGGAAGGGGAAAAKKARTAEGSSEEALASELRESLRLPHGMKLKLIEDWERITREKKTVPLPSCAARRPRAALAACASSCRSHTLVCPAPQPHTRLCAARRVPVRQGEARQHARAAVRRGVRRGPLLLQPGVTDPPALQV